MEIISIIGSVQTFFYALLLRTKIKKNSEDFILIILMLLLGLVFLDNYFRNTGFYDVYPSLWGVTYCFPLLISPLMYFYVLIITSPERKISPFNSLFLIPFAVFISYFIYDYYFLPASAKKDYLSRAANEPWLMIYLAESFIIAGGPVSAVLSLIRLKKHSNNIAAYFSYKEDINLNWLKTVFVLVIATNAVMLLSNFFSDIIPLISWQQGDNIMHSANVILVFIIGYKGFKQVVIYKPAADSEEPAGDISQEKNNHNIRVPGIEKAKYVKSGLTMPEAEKIYTDLLNLIEKNEAFLDPKLSIRYVADKLGINVNYVSQVINQKTGKNFFRFINEFRVRKAETLLKTQSENYTILAIAFDCGFNSKSSFNTIFKEYVGCTPSEFIKRKS